MASLPGSGGEPAAAGSAGGLLPLSTSPSLAGFAQQAPLAAQVQLPLNLGNLQSQLLMPLGGGPATGGGQPPLDVFFPLSFPQHQPQQAHLQAQPAQHMQQQYLQQHQQLAPGGSAMAGQPTMPLPTLALPFGAGGTGGGVLAGLPLNWPIPGDAGGSTVQVVQLPPSSSGILSVPPGDLLAQRPGQGPNVAQQRQQQQQQQLQQQQALEQQQALSAPQIMSNTDHNGSTEGTQAWGGGTRRASGRGGGTARSPVEAEESGAAESRLKAAPSGRRGRGGGEPARKSRFRGVQWDKNGSKWRARIHTDKTRHIGYYETEEEAARAWDLAALKHFGETAEVKSKLNFPNSIAVFRQQQQQHQAAAAALAQAPAGDGGSGGAGGTAQPGSVGPSSCSADPQYRGVHRMADGRFRCVVTQKRTPFMIGTFDTAEECARAYDRESLRLNGRGAITNFPLSDYAAEGLLDGSAAAPRGQSSPVPCAPLCQNGSGDLQAESMQACAAVVAGPQQAAQQWQRGGSVPPATGPASVMLHTPAVVGQLSPKRRKLADDSVATAPMLPLPQHLQQPMAAAAVGQLGGGGRVGASAPAPGGPGVFQSPPDASGSRNDESAGFAGVLRVASAGGDEWHAYLSVDLGRFGSAEEAAHAHDRAALLASGLQAATNRALPDVFAASIAACAPAVAVPGQQYRGVVNRCGNWLALLDVAGSPYELGPYPSEVAAAQAYDRYSMLLHGVKAQTNFPPWHYLASAAECQSLVTAVAQVQQQQAAAGGSGTPQGTKMPTPPSADRSGPQQQQQPVLPASHQQQQQLQRQQVGGAGQPGQAPAQLQQEQQDQLQQQQQAQLLLQQHMGLPALADRLPPPPRLPSSQALTQQHQRQNPLAGQAASLPVLPQAADLGSQLARLSSLQALAGMAGPGFSGPGGLAGGAEAPWPAQQQQQHGHPQQQQQQQQQQHGQPQQQQQQQQQQQPAQQQH